MKKTFSHLLFLHFCVSLSALTALSTENSHKRAEEGPSPSRETKIPRTENPNTSKSHLDNLHCCSLTKPSKNWKIFETLPQSCTADENPFEACNSRDLEMDEKSGIICPGTAKSLSTYGLCTCFGIALRGLNNQGELIRVGLFHDSGIGTFDSFVEKFMKQGKEPLHKVQVLLAGGMSYFGARAADRAEEILETLAESAASKGIEIEQGEHKIDLAGEGKNPKPLVINENDKNFQKIQSTHQLHIEIGYSAAILINPEGHAYFINTGFFPAGAGAVYGDFLAKLASSTDIKEVFAFLEDLSKEDLRGLKKIIAHTTQAEKGSFIQKFVNSLEPINGKKMSIPDNIEKLIENEIDSLIQSESKKNGASS
jgi:hypothetical protein